MKQQRVLTLINRGEKIPARVRVPKAKAGALRGGESLSGFVDTGVRLITDDPAVGAPSADVAFGVRNCWGNGRGARAARPRPSTSTFSPVAAASAATPVRKWRRDSPGIDAVRSGQATVL